MKPLHLILAIATFTRFSTAWPSPSPFDDTTSISELDDFLRPRQNDAGNSGGSDNTSQGSDNTDGGSNGGSNPSSGSDSSGSPNTATITSKPSKATGSVATSASKSNGATSAKSKTSSLASIPSDAYPGGVNFVSPNTQYASSQYYAMSQGFPSTVTWVWNYTSLLRTPAAIDVVATMASTAGGLNPSPFTISSNYSFNPTQTFKWDTGSYAETSVMPNGIYTLLIYDADAAGGATAIPTPGKLEPYSQFSFGVYSPLPYIAVSPSLVCTTCNAAGGKMEKLTWGVLTGVVGLTMATTLWFTGINGVW